MTPAVQAVKDAGIQYQLHEYQHDAQASSYGEEAANLLKVPSDRVFKTLLVSTNTQQLAVTLIPVSHQLDLKAVAKALKVKKAIMANPADAEKATGYILGGISPLGQKIRLPFIIDESATVYDTIYISGGKRGLEIELAPRDLIQLCDANVACIRCKLNINKDTPPPF